GSDSLAPGCMAIEHRGQSVVVTGRSARPSDDLEAPVEIGREIDVEDRRRLNQISDTSYGSPGAEQSTSFMLVVERLIPLDAPLVSERHQKTRKLVADEVRKPVEEGHEIIQQGFRHGESSRCRSLQASSFDRNSLYTIGYIECLTRICYPS